MEINQKYFDSTSQIALIGCGNIAGGDWPVKPPVTHLAAIQSIGFNVTDVYDIDPLKAKSFAQKWNIPYVHHNFEDLISKNYDLIIITSPPINRSLLLKKIVFKTSCKTFVLEKPLGSDFEEVKEIEKIVNENHLTLIVPLIRSWVPGIQHWSRKAKSGELGKFMGGSGYYTKGLNNNGSHLVTLILDFLNMPKTCSNLGKIEDGRIEDPTFHFQFNYEAGSTLTVTGLDHREYSQLELDLFFQKGRLRISESGKRISWSPAKDDPIYPGYKSIEESPSQDTHFEEHFSNFYKSILTPAGGIPIQGNLKNAVASAYWINEIARKKQVQHE